MKKLCKVTMNLPQDVVDYVQAVATVEGIAFVDVIRRAINAEKFFVDAKRSGNKVLMELKDGKIKEIIRV